MFINGVVYEVPGRGALLDLAGTFGRDAMLVHSSGEILPVNENGILMKRLQMGECYYLVGEPAVQQMHELYYMLSVVMTLFTTLCN